MSAKKRRDRDNDQELRKKRQARGRGRQRGGDRGRDQTEGGKEEITALYRPEMTHVGIPCRALAALWSEYADGS